MNYGFFKGLTPPSFEPFFTELFFVISLSPSLLIYSLERCSSLCMCRAKGEPNSGSFHDAENTTLTKKLDRSPLRTPVSGGE
jgi:hypothetical protein